MWNKRICSSLALLLLLMVGFSACMTKKKMARLKETYQLFRTGMDSLGNENIWEERKIVEGDKLYITIRTESLNQDQLAWFDNGKETLYVVSDEGWINLPFIGRLNVVGIGRKQAMDLIREKLKLIIKEPYVQIKPLEINVKVMGQVERESILALQENDATLINALIQAGGLNELSKRDSISVIRIDNGKRIIYNVDIRDGQKFFNSTAFKLRQNDLIIVNPNNYYFKKLRNQETAIDIARISPLTIFIGMFGIIVPVIAILRR